MLNMKAVKGVNPKSPHHKEKMSFSFIVYLYEMMNVHWTYCGNHFMMYTSQIIRLYTLHAYSSVCQLYLTVKGKKSRNWPTGSKIYMETELLIAEIPLKKKNRAGRSHTAEYQDLF